jgi:hypothetical protein
MRAHVLACPRGSILRLPTRGSSGATKCRWGSSTYPLAQGSSEAAKCQEDGLYTLPAIKQILSSGPAIMIFMSAYLPRHYTTRVVPLDYRACGRRPIKYRRDVWTGRLQGLVGTAKLPPGHNGLQQY